MNLSEYIVQYIDDHEISLNELSRKCGVSKGYMSMIVQGCNPSTGKPIVPSIKILQRIATGTGTTLNDLCAVIDSYVSLHQDAISSVPAAEAIAITPDEADLLTAYREAPDTLKDAAFRVLGSERQERSFRSQNAG